MSDIAKELSPIDIHKYFEYYKFHMDKIQEYEDKLYSETDHDKWIENYNIRSKCIRDAYESNTEVTDQLMPYLEGEKFLPDNLADCLYDELINLDVSKYDDPFYAIYYVRALIKYYERANDLGRTLVLYNRLGWEYMSSYRIGYKENARKAYECYITVLSHRDKYATFTDPNYRRTFFVAYHNIIRVMPSFSIISLDKAFGFLDEFTEFYYSPLVQKLDKENSEIKELYELSCVKILHYESKIFDCSLSVREKFCVLARKIYKDACQRCNGEYYIPAEILLANYKALIMERRCSYSEAMEYLLSYYDIRRAINAEKSSNPDNVIIDSEFDFEVYFPDSIIFDWLKDSRVSKEMRNRETAKLIKSKYDYLERVSRSTYTVFLNQTITDWCFKSLNLLDSFKDKAYALANIVIKRQMPTFFHSYMVADLAVMVTEAALKRDPSIFSRMYPGCSDEEILMHKEEIIDFITKGALFHDIGKTRITNVINMQSRKLFSEEIELIRKHPGIGADSLDEDFDDYHDIILGHHKHFDGEHGYPFRYNSKYSKNKVALDIIAICDSLDAATDYLGRNYAPKKRFDEVLKEFEDASVDRYNAFFVDLLKTDKDLYNKIDVLLKEGREEKYYRLIQEHLHNN